MGTPYIIWNSFPDIQCKKIAFTKCGLTVRMSIEKRRKFI